MCGRMSSTRSVLTAAYAVSASKRAGIDHEDLPERRDLRRRDVGPVQAAVVGRVYQPVVGARPDSIDVQVRRANRVDDAQLPRLRAALAGVLPDARRRRPVGPRQVRADLLPADAAVNGLPQVVVRVEQRPRVHRREHHWLRAHGPVARLAGSSRPTAAAGNRRHARHLPRAPIVARHLAAEHDVRIERVGRHVAVLLDADRVPFAERDLPVVAAARDARRSALLLAAADAVRPGVVGHDVVELRRRLVVPRAPASGLRSA